MQKFHSFKKQLEDKRCEIVNRLLQKAFTANRLAKVCRGATRSHLYILKYRYLSAAIEVLPNSFYVDSQSRIGPSEILGIRSVEGFAFHVPVGKLSSDALARIDVRQKE